MKELQELCDQFKLEYNEAPMFGSYSRTLKTKIPSRGDVQRSFLDSLQLLAKLETDVKVTDKITSILKNFM